MRFISPSSIFLLLIIALLASAPLFAEQRCNEAIPATAPDGRYVDHGDGTVTDGLTGLMWKRCAEGLSGTDCATGSVETHTWQQALELAPLSNFAGYTDWRLPNIKELSTLVERRCYDPAINANSFPNTPSSWFWSASPLAYGSDHAWYSCSSTMGTTTTTVRATTAMCG